MPKSVLEAIKLGVWDFEPPEADPTEFEAADAMPGTKEKLHVMAERVERGLPIWHEQIVKNLTPLHRREGICNNSLLNMCDGFYNLRNSRRQGSLSI